MTPDERAADTPRAGPSRAATLLLVGAILGAAVVIFAWMNTDAVGVKVFLWEPRISKALLMFVPLAIGLVLGWGLRASRARKKKRKKTGEGGGEARSERPRGRGPTESDGGGGAGTGGGVG